MKGFFSSGGKMPLPPLPQPPQPDSQSNNIPTSNTWASQSGSASSSSSASVSVAATAYQPLSIPARSSSPLSQGVFASASSSSTAMLSTSPDVQNDTSPFSFGLPWADMVTREQQFVPFPPPNSAGAAALSALEARGGLYSDPSSTSVSETSSASSSLSDCFDIDSLRNDMHNFSNGGTSTYAPPLLSSSFSGGGSLPNDDFTGKPSSFSSSHYSPFLSMQPVPQQPLFQQASLQPNTNSRSLDLFSDNSQLSSSLGGSSFGFDGTPKVARRRSIGAFNSRAIPGNGPVSDEIPPYDPFGAALHNTTSPQPFRGNHLGGELTPKSPKKFNWLSRDEMNNGDSDYSNRQPTTTVLGVPSLPSTNDSEMVPQLPGDSSSFEGTFSSSSSTSPFTVQSSFGNLTRGRRSSSSASNLYNPQPVTEVRVSSQQTIWKNVESAAFVPSSPVLRAQAAQAAGQSASGMSSNSRYFSPGASPQLNARGSSAMNIPQLPIPPRSSSPAHSPGRHSARASLCGTDFPSDMQQNSRAAVIHASGRRNSLQQPMPYPPFVTSGSASASLSGHRRERSLPSSPVTLPVGITPSNTPSVGGTMSLSGSTGAGGSSDAASADGDVDKTMSSSRQKVKQLLKKLLQDNAAASDGTQDPLKKLVSFFRQPNVNTGGAEKWIVFLELADMVRRDGDMDTARQLYRDVVAMKPKKSQCWLEYAKMEEECGNLEQARLVLRRGLKQCQMCETLMIRAMKIEEKMNNIAGAHALLSKLKDQPLEKTWRTFLEGALMDARCGCTDAARKVFTYLMNSVPWYGPIFLEAFRFEERCEEFDKAISVVEHGLKENPKYGPLWFSAIRLYERMAPERLPATLQMASECLLKDLKWKVFFEMAQIQERSGNFAEARTAYQTATEYCPPNLEWKIWFGAARTELITGDYKAARELIEKSLSMVPVKMCPAVLLEKARLEEYAGDVDAARKILAEAKVTARHEWKVFLETVLLEIRAGDLDAARERVKEALGVHAGTGRLWAVHVQLACGKTLEEQMALFQQALKEVPKSGEVWCEGARLYMKQGNHAEARKCLANAAQFTPQYGDSFIEYLRNELLEKGEFSTDCPLEQQCINAEPNYGPMWLFCKRNPLESPHQVLRNARKILYDALIVNPTGEDAQRLSDVNIMYKSALSLPPGHSRLKLIFGSDLVKP